jgi:hypothetical protein
VSLLRPLLLLPVAAGLLPSFSTAADQAFKDKVEPILIKYCFDCHGDGTDKGDVSLDFENPSAALKDLDLWERVWHNVESQMMPPADKKQPTTEEIHELTRWIGKDVFRLDPAKPDPGRVTVRRLNREEYRNSIQDLLGVSYRVEDNFSPDDTGYGFDTIGDVLSLSPVLLEKYLDSAQEIVVDAVPLEAGKMPYRAVKADEFKLPKAEDPNGKTTAKYIPFAKPMRLVANRWVGWNGDYKIDLVFKVTGSVEATENTAVLRVFAGTTKVAETEIGWDTREKIYLSGKTKLTRANTDFVIELEPRTPPREGESPLVARVELLQFQGPLDGSVKEFSTQYRRIMVDGAPPKAEDGEGRKAYARKILAPIAERAFRRPVDEATVNRLVEIALLTDQLADTAFEEGIRQAIAGILVSPRFLFRAETQPQPNDPAKIVPLDDFALASRLSYFLWNSLPDQALLDLARKGELRPNLNKEVERLLKDPRAERFFASFVGQWLQARDVTTINVDPRAVLGLKDLEAAFKIFNGDVRRDMQRESEMLFAHVLRENRPVTELLTANYTFLSEKLAEFYGIDGVDGRDMRKVDLKPEARRGGILRQGNFLVVTSNPNRTSPVKRGLFVLENVLATPAPPAPPNVPALEAAKKSLKNPTVRELMELHRQNALCASCHARMDPLGLAFEHYNAIGQWRDDEKGKPIDPAGKLVTGESFSDLDQLINALATSRRHDVIRALVEKLMIYSLGRGTEYYDRPEIDRIVAAVERKNGTLRAVIDELVASAAFQQRRGDGSRVALK